MFHCENCSHHDQAVDEIKELQPRVITRSGVGSGIKGVEDKKTLFKHGTVVLYQRGWIWNQRGGIMDQRGGIKDQRGGIRDQRDGIRDQKGGIRDHIPGIRGHKLWYRDQQFFQGSGCTIFVGSGIKTCHSLESRIKNWVGSINNAKKNLITTQVAGS